MLLGGNVNFADWIAGQMKTLDDYSVCLLLTICWKIWEARNQKLWRNLRTNSRTITEDAISFLHAWRNIHPDSCIRAQVRTPTSKFAQLMKLLYIQAPRYST
nr:Polynucleotidyl transferase, Ribonuclease H fold [Ipomoea batatas]GMD09264.1 Polynucleotidyl transferase, Ribonuclease H fold [Ipomoea batatas]GME05095.1 Polynucleotidyl transferase, Ribonuclease H fold [Ipomoea batatas]